MKIIILMNDLYQLLDNLKSTERLIDVRTPNEYSQGHVPGSLNIPMGNEQSFLEELSSYQRIFVHCHSGSRAQTVYTMLGMQWFGKCFLYQQFRNGRLDDSRLSCGTVREPPQ